MQRDFLLQIKFPIASLRFSLLRVQLTSSFHNPIKAKSQLADKWSKKYCRMIEKHLLLVSEGLKTTCLCRVCVGMMKNLIQNEKLKLRNFSHIVFFCVWRVEVNSS